MPATCLLYYYSHVCLYCEVDIASATRSYHIICATLCARCNPVAEINGVNPVENYGINSTTPVVFYQALIGQTLCPLWDCENHRAKNTFKRTVKT